jgi:outer membrane protein insertion porin family
MMFPKAARLPALIACLCALPVWPGAAQNAPPAQQPPGSTSAPQQAPRQQPAPQQQNPNPFENVPENPLQLPPVQQPPPQPAPPRPAAPAQPQIEAPPQAVAVPTQPNGRVIEAVEFRGARRVPQDTLKALILSKSGDIYNADQLRRDFMALWNTQRFDDITLETEPGRSGVIVRFVVVERRVIRAIDYTGLHSVTVSDILDRFKERKVGLTVESQYDPNKVQRAVVVLKDLLGERGRQYASVDPVIEQIPPSSLKITFKVDEGPKVQVGKIDIEGNTAFSSNWVIWQMKNSRPYGIPHSILFENMFAKTYDSDKLEEDKELVRQSYQDKGYFTVKVLDQTVTMVDRGGAGWKFPLIYPNNRGKYADIKLPLEEGKLYHLRNTNFVGVKFFKAPETLMRPIFGMTTGDVFSTEKLRKGLDNLRKLYGEFGFIDFVPEPDFNVDTQAGQVDLTLTADEGKQFFIRRIDFSGNLTTRDKVIRRELLLDEGDLFNTHLWEISILRLNQLGYFEMLKQDDAAQITRNPQSNTVDITLKVKERGKNSIGLNGGVSGIAGSFIGFNYSTNNFLGLGETLSLNSQIGTIMKSATLSFTEPYLFDQPIQAGFSVFYSNYDFNQARQASIFAGQNLIPLYNSLGSQNLLNYTQDTRGFTVSASHQIKRSFARVGLTFGYSLSSVKATTTAAETYFDYINFDGVYGPNALNGIRTSHITPSYLYNTVNHPINPTAGRSLYFAIDFAGSVLGGNVNTVRPTADFKYFKQDPWHKRNVFAFHVTSSLIVGYGGKLVPPFARTFLGGEQDVRGFEFFTITPIAFIASTATVDVLNADGTARTQNVSSPSGIVKQPVTMQIPAYQIVTPGGDTHAVANFEYRIPIVGPVTLAPFVDAGVNRILLPSQLEMDPARVAQLNQQFPQAGFTGQAIIAPGTQSPRVSTGLEIQVMLPVVNAPFRVYWAYNPLTVREYIQPPVVADRAFFPNQATYNNAVTSIGTAYPYFERRDLFRFTIGRTF